MIPILSQSSKKKNWNVKQIMRSRGNSLGTLQNIFYDVTESCFCDWLARATAKEHDWPIVVAPLVLFHRITWMLTCSSYNRNHAFSAGTCYITPAHATPLRSKIRKFLIVFLGFFFTRHLLWLEWNSVMYWRLVFFKLNNVVFCFYGSIKREVHDGYSTQLAEALKKKKKNHCFWGD